MEPQKQCPKQTAGSAETKLQDLQSLIAHAHKIEQDTEYIARMLKQHEVDPQAYTLTSDLATSLRHIHELLTDSDDIYIRELLIVPLNRKGFLVFVEGMVNEEMLNDHILKRLTETSPYYSSQVTTDTLIPYLINTLLPVTAISQTEEMNTVVKRVLSGDVALCIDGIAPALVIAARKLESRAIAESQTEKETNGPRDGFTEDLRINITLIRRRFKNPNLIVKKAMLGVRTDTDVAIIYLRGIADMRVICEVERRLQSIAIDFPPASGLQGLLEDHPYSPFPTIMLTERPDKLMAALAMGKVGILLDGTPFSFIVPTVLPDFFRAGEDVYEKWQVGTLIRFTRYLAAFFSLALPALYVAITAFHPAFLPTPLTLTIGVSRQGVPFPAAIEAVLMISLLEMMQEAGIRMPRTIGPAVSIVGGLVIGDAAVRAGLASTTLVIVTSATAIASFNVVQYSIGLPLRLFRVPLMALGASFGMLGLVVGLVALAIHLSQLKSFGVPYLAPLIPPSLRRVNDTKETLLVTPDNLRKQRPAYLDPQDTNRQSINSNQGDTDA